jgi:imidazolonepropionase-like amidohydrolase
MLMNRRDAAGGFMRACSTVGARLAVCSVVALVMLAPRQLGAAETPNGPQTVVYAGEALLVPGTPSLRDVAIFISGDRIVDIKVPAVPATGATDHDDYYDNDNAATIIDLSCCFVVPGLIDTQTHLQSQPGFPPAAVRLATWTDADLAVRGMVHARRTLEAGFTTVRDMGSHGNAMFALRDAINEGRIAGPRLQVAGEIIRPTGGELRAWFRPDVEQVLRTSAVCDGADNCRRAVRAQVALGSDTIKVETKKDLLPGSSSQFAPDELEAIAETAHRLGVRVTASAFSAESINLPLQAGFDAVVHGTFADDETLALLRSSSAYFIPTLVAARTVKEIAEDPDAAVSEAWRRENLAIYDGMIGSFQGVLESDLRIAFGTDAGWRPHGGNAEQLVQMVELGMTGADAIASATVNAADAIGWSDDVGSLEKGKYADIVATRDSPLRDISELRRPVFVMKGGRIAYRRD